MADDGAFRAIPGSPQESALASTADITIFGGANGGGKTAALVAAAARGHDDGGWNGVIFRRTYPELDQPGGVIDQSQKFYPDYGEYNSTKSEWRFPSGARVSFSHMKHEDNKTDWDGAELTFIGFDQLEQFSQSQFTYMLGRLRSPDSSWKPHVFATCNPGGEGHWLYDFLSWWIDDNGFPISDRAGELRHFHRDGDEIEWVRGPDVLSEEGDEPVSVTFIPATVDDNPHVGPGYKRFLNSLSELKKKEKRFGQWGLSDDDNPLSAHAIQTVEAIPDDAGRPVRYWDLADTDRQADHADSASHTAGVKGVCFEREWTICQHNDDEKNESCSFWSSGSVDRDACPQCGHEALDTRPREVLLIIDAVWFQLEGSDKEDRICSVARADGAETLQVFEREPGQSGKDVARKWRKRKLPDLDVEDDHPTGQKRDRMSLWVPEAESGRFWVVGSDRTERYRKALVDMSPMDVVDATSGVAKCAPEVAEAAKSGWCAVGLN